MDGMKEVFRDITAYWEKSETPEIFNKRKFIALLRRIFIKSILKKQDLNHEQSAAIYALQLWPDLNN